MAYICLEDLWRARLHRLGWSSRATEQLLLHWSKATLEQYNRHVQKFQLFCEKTEVVYPCSDDRIIAAFFCDLADSSPRPKSTLNVAAAALTCLFQALAINTPVMNECIRKLVDGLIKGGTTAPMVKTPVMPVRPFYNLFQSWPSNMELSLRHHRLKTVCLLALVFMLRPSDIAPRACKLDPINLAAERLTFNEDNVGFQENGQLTVHFHGIKNDYGRDGFTVTISPANDPKIDPVLTLREYMARTAADRVRIKDKPVFITLKRPFRVLCAKSISGVLQEAISLAGLGGLGYSAKCFRPTGATCAIDNNVNPDKARHIGRWQSQDVFEKHYVHTRVPGNYVDTLMQS